MSAQYMSGPWRVVEHSWEEVSVYGADTEPVCQLHISSLVDEDTEQAYAAEMLSNARLIAAAPELLEALQEVRWEVHQYSEGFELLWAKVDAAIRKATGEEQ